jgi:hypothetical protein
MSTYCESTVITTEYNQSRSNRLTQCNLCINGAMDDGSSKRERSYSGGPARLFIQRLPGQLSAYFNARGELN